MKKGALGAFLQEWIVWDSPEESMDLCFAMAACLCNDAK